MFCEFRVFRGKNNLPQNSQNSQNLLLRYTLTELTETTIRMFCEFRVFRGKKQSPTELAELTEHSAEIYFHGIHGNDDMNVL